MVVVAGLVQLSATKDGSVGVFEPVRIGKTGCRICGMGPLHFGGDGHGGGERERGNGGRGKRGLGGRGAVSILLDEMSAGRRFLESRSVARRKREDKCRAAPPSGKVAGPGCPVARTLGGGRQTEPPRRPSTGPRLSSARPPRTRPSLPPLRHVAQNRVHELPPARHVPRRDRPLPPLSLRVRPHPRQPPHRPLTQLRRPPRARRRPLFLHGRPHLPDQRPRCHD